MKKTKKVVEATCEQKVVALEQHLETTEALLLRLLQLEAAINGSASLDLEGLTRARTALRGQINLIGCSYADTADSIDREIEREAEAMGPPSEEIAEAA